MKLSQLHNQQTAFVTSIEGSPAFRLRLEELGFVPGQEIKRIYASPMGSPIVFAMLGQRVALRKSEAELISVAQQAPVFADISTTTQCANANKPSLRPQAIVSPHDVGRLRPVGHIHAAHESTHSGDFHAASCSPSSCASCSGCATRRELPPKTENTITMALVGNPNCGKTTLFNVISGGHERTGNYAGVTVSSIVGERTFEGQPLRVIDLPGTYSLHAYSPEEAYVMHELQKGEIDVILNVLDVNNLERNLLLTLQLRSLGIPVVGVLNFYDEFDESESLLDINRLSERLGIPFVRCVASREEGVNETLHTALQQIATSGESSPSQQSTQTKASLSTDATALHAEVHHLIEDIYTLKEGRAVRLTTTIDQWLVKSGLSYVAFLLIMYFVFQATFTLGAYPMDWMDSGVAWLGEWVSQTLQPSWFTDLLVDGIIGGVGAVIVFLPNILILYFFISILEDSGYLARAAFLFDPLLRRVGLHGKSFFPMLTGFGCNVPAVMATRTIESRKSRIVTMLTLPFMSCSARLPVYVVFTAAFFPQSAGLLMFCLYLGGILIAFISAKVLTLFIRRSEESHFVMEIPPYRRPVAQSVLRHTWEKGRQYLQKMGGLILIASMVVWFLGYFPRAEGDAGAAQQQEQSYLGRAGHQLEPILAPLGFDWRMGVGILTGAMAKELMVSTLGVLYHLDEEAASDVGSGDNPQADSQLSAALRSATTPAAALAYIVFALLYFPCLATIIAIRGESGRWRYAILAGIYSTLLAYLAAWATYEIANGVM